MGKKKSVALMVLLTIVMIALCGLVLFPSVPVGVKDWKPVALQYDFSTELDGGYYAYYYPEGVIPATEYEDDLKGYQELVNDAKDDKEKKEAQDQLDKHVDSYKAYKGLYLSTEDKYGIFVNYEEISQDFTSSFNKTAKEIVKRYEKKGYSDCSVSVVDDYSIRVELPKAEKNYSSVFSMLAYTGEMRITIGDGDELVKEMKEDAKASDLIESVSVSTRYNMAYVKVKFTEAGEEMIAREKENLTDSNTATTAMHIKVGEHDILQIYSDSIKENNREARPFYVEKENKDVVEIYSILLNSALENETEFTFDLSRIEAREFESVHGDNTITLLYIALGIILLASIILPVIKMGRFGIVGAYTNLSYLTVVAICYKFLLGSVFELTLGGVLVFIAGLVLVNVLQAYIYSAIKKEFSQGKTVMSSVKGGYKKTLWNIVDIYAVLVLGAICLFIGVGGVSTLAVHALVALVMGAFCNLLWARFINYVYLSASKNQFKYFRFVREEDDDDDE
ncbi:MAG: hypothetical protein E7368_01085 [Clostridiales bacterium]|nr:hypothetical protein [Clostridiales bacterium]